MAKDPAFLFYPGDWLGGTLTFTRSHKGAYMDLLICQFNQGHMALQDIKILLNSDYDSMWEQKLKVKFTVDDNGHFFNERLEEEIIRRKLYGESRRKNLNSKKKKPPHKAPHMEPHMETEDENKDRKEDIKVKINFAEFVNLTQAENNKLISKHGTTLTAAAIEELNNHKGAKGVKYKSDYHAILKWAIDAATARNGNKPKAEIRTAKQVYE